MKIKPVLWLGVLLFIMACELPGLSSTATPTPQVPPTRIVEVLPTVTSACLSPEPTQEDIDRALGFTGKIFETGDWERSYTVADNRVSVSWLSDSLFAVAFLEANIFPCSYEEPDLNAYFNDDYWEVIFEYYDSYQLVTECHDDSGLRLYEFNAMSSSVEYDTRYWVGNDTATRVITFMMVLPTGSTDLMEDYAYSLFPTLSNCK